METAPSDLCSCRHATLPAPLASPEGHDALMRRRFFVLHNPNAGAAARRYYHKILALLTASGASLECVETSRHGEGMRVAAEAAASLRYDAIVAAGGDGTVHHAAAGLVGSPVPLGMIPTGTANVFAREVGMLRPPEQVAKALMSGEVKAVPIGQVNGRPFLFVVGIGFDAAAVRRFENNGTRKLGQAGFVVPVMHALFSQDSRSLDVTTDRGASEAEWVIVTRARRYAGGFLLCSEADIMQTSFHVLRFAGRGAFVRMRQLSALACGLVRFDPDVTVEAAEWVRIRGDADTPVQVDGEMLGTLPVEISLHPHRLQLIFQRRERAESGKSRASPD
jgi:diacylglycerol kinase (ATP)